MANKYDLEALQAANFVNAARTHVERAYLELTGDESAEGLDLEYMRGQCQKLTAVHRIAQTAPVAAPEPKGIGRIPNLSPSGKWEGRMRRVTIHKTDQNSAVNAIQLGWEGVTWIVLYDQPVDMPWPYWQALKNARRLDISDKAVKWERDPETLASYKVTKPIDKPTYSYIDHGDVPGTENKPEGYVEFFRLRARATSMFRETPPAALMLIHQHLYDGPPTDKNHQPIRVDNTALRMRIAERLGKEFVDILNDEIYAAA